MLLPEKDRVLTHQQISVIDESLSQLEAVESKLAKELHEIRSRISNIRSQRAALQSRIAAVWSLPNELLSYIFELGVMEEQAEADEEDDEAEDKEEEQADKIDFQVLVSQVCRMFRQVAVRTPSLWTRIHIFDLEPPRLDFLQTCVKRSGKTGLDILLETEHLYVEDDGDQLESFSNTLVPHIYRLKRFVVRLQGFSCLHSLMCKLDRPAPLLEVLELSDIDYEASFDEDEPFDPSELHSPLTLFQGAAPKLCRLNLDGIHVDWSACNFKNLVELKLGYHTRDVRPSYDEFKVIILASPALQTLELTGSAPLISEDADPALYTPIPMEQLARLTIANIPSDYVTTLVSLLQAPNLTFLALTDMDANDFSGLARKIAGPPVMFPTLTSLKLATLEVDDAAYEYLLRAYPTLTYLSIYFDRSSPKWLDVLGLRGEDHEVVCPKLECLRCVGASTSDIRDVLETRRDAGFQIPRLELDQDTVGCATTACMQWIRDNAQVEIIVPSEHGSEDEDMNETGSEWITDEDDAGIDFPYFSMEDFYSDMGEVDEDEDYEGEGEESDDDDENDSDVEVDGSEESDGSEDTGVDITDDGE